jgi:class 3 adenylate cyclase
MARASAHADISASVDRTLDKEARRAEMMLASVRTVALGPVVLLNGVLYFFPAQAGFAHVNALLPLLAGGWFVAAAAFAAALRRGFYRAWVTTVIPVIDAVLIFATFANAWSLARDGDAEVRRGVVMVWSISAALLAASGGLRLTRRSAIFTTVLAFASYLAMVATTTHAVWTIYGLTLLISIGALGMWMVGIMRRAIRSEVSKVTLQRFLPDRVIEASGRDPLALLTEPRVVDATVMVTDLRGFTTMAEKMTPTEAFALLNEVQGAFARAVTEQGGTVDKFLGDGMLAVFGAPEPQEDHAARAVEAVLAIRKAIAALNAKRAEQGLPALKIGVGVHSGAVVTGCLGSGARLEFTVIGDTVNTTSRLESATKEKGVDVLVSGETARRLGEQAGAQELSILEPLGEIALRGRDEPLAISGLRGGDVPSEQRSVE